MSLILYIHSFTLMNQPPDLSSKAFSLDCLSKDFSKELQITLCNIKVTVGAHD